MIWYNSKSLTNVTIAEFFDLVIVSYTGILMQRLEYARILKQKVVSTTNLAGGKASLPSLVPGSDFTVPENRAYHVIMAITLDIMSFYQLYFL